MLRCVGRLRFTCGCMHFMVQKDLILKLHRKTGAKHFITGESLYRLAQHPKNLLKKLLKISVCDGLHKLTPYIVIHKINRENFVGNLSL